MRDKILRKMAAWHSEHPWRMLVIALIITFILTAAAGQLTVTMRTSDLLPENDPKVVQFNRIVDEFSTASNLIIVVQGEEQGIKYFADALAPKIEALRDSSQNERFQEDIDKLNKKITKLKNQTGKERKIEGLLEEIDELQKRIDMKLFQRVNYKVDLDFIRDHGLMLVKAEDLKNTKDVFFDSNLIGLIKNYNDSMEKEYIGQEESISTREKEDGAFVFLDGIQGLIQTMKDAGLGEELSPEDIKYTADKLFLGEPYMLSYDKTTLLLVALPNFTLMDRDLIMTGVKTVQATVDDLLKDNSDIQAGLTGGLAREHDETVYSQQSLGYTTIIALILILLMLMISFRMWIAPVLAVANLIVGLIWAMGVAFLVVGQLNMFTAMMSIVLLGLGIDFSIHIISSFTEWRAAGDNISTAMNKTFQKSGKGILTGGVTTACAFLTLIISQTRGFREMGVVTGLGLLSIMLATFFFLPSLLVFRERRVDKKRERKPAASLSTQRDITFKFLGKASQWMTRKYVFTIVAAILITTLMAWSAFQIEFDRNYENMEPKGLKFMELGHLIMEKFEMHTEYSLVLADSLEESREFSEAYRKQSSVAMTDDISLFLPSTEQQGKRIPHIQEIRDKIEGIPIKESITDEESSFFLQQIDRLRMNIMEMQDMAFIGGQDKVDNKCKLIVGDPDDPNSPNLISEFLQEYEKDKSQFTAALSRFQNDFSPYFRDSILRMSSTEGFKLEDLPDSILDRYSNANRDQFLISVYPSGNIWADPEVLDRHVEDLYSITDKATGGGPLINALLSIFGRDGRNAVLLTLAVVFLLLVADFRSIRNALIAMVPLGVGLFWMVGIMNLVGMKLSIMNVMGLPLIIGIGIDDGVHIMHRLIHEGEDRIHTVFSSTGKAIFLTSVTTMLAFGSLVFSVMPAWAQFGSALFVGVGTCFLTTVIVIPGLLGLTAKKK